MRKLPSLNRLRAFEAAARLESFTLAARELHLTASAISHQIKDLEQEFGRPLFVRQSRSVKPTLEGQRLHQSLVRIFDALEAACAEVAQPVLEQVLAVHCAPTLAVKWLAPRLATLIARHPDLKIRLTTGAEPVDLTQSREVDLAIGYGFVHDRPGVTVIPLGDERIVPLVSPRLIEGAGDIACLLQSLPLIESQLNPVSWQHWFVQNRLPIPPRPGLSFDRAALAISAAADGMGVALESTRLAERELDRGELVILGEAVFDPICRPTHFLCLRDNERNVEKIRTFVDWLLSEVETPKTGTLDLNARKRIP